MVMIVVIRYGEEEGNFHIIIVNDELEKAYVALRCKDPTLYHHLCHCLGFGIIVYTSVLVSLVWSWYHK